METSTQITTAEKKPKVLQWSLIIAIIIVTNLFFNYAISLVYTEPSYDKFCPAEVYSKAYDDKGSCLANGGMWNEQVVPVDSNSNIKNGPKTQITGYCNATYTCQKNYDTANKTYSRNVFIILVSLGILIIVAGAFIGVSLLSIAFSWSGVLSLVIASMRYWGSAENLVRVIILAAALAALIWLSVKKFSK